MPKAILSKFLVDRIHTDWVDRLYPQGYKVEVGVGVGQRGRGIYNHPSPHTTTSILKFNNSDLEINPTECN